MACELLQKARVAHGGLDRPGKTGIVLRKAPISPIWRKSVWKSEPLEQEPSHKLSPNEH
jgi:hypothetical protein